MGRHLGNVEKRLRHYLPGGDFKNVSPIRSRTMRAIKGRGTKTTEQRLRGALVQARIRDWKLQPRGIFGSPDVVFLSKNLVIFVDGCFWHGCPRCGHLPQANRAYWKAKIAYNRQRDRITERELRKNGFVVLRFWEHELADDLGRCIKRIRTTLSPTKRSRHSSRKRAKADAN